MKSLILAILVAVIIINDNIVHVKAHFGLKLLKIIQKSLSRNKKTIKHGYPNILGGSHSYGKSLALAGASGNFLPQSSKMS